MLFCARGDHTTTLSDTDIREELHRTLEALGPRESVMAIPPDITRFHSQAGRITCMMYDYLGTRLKTVLPAVGTHAAVTTAQMARMFPGMPHDLFKHHNWRSDTVTLGRIEPEFIEEQSEGRLTYDYPAQLNRSISDGSHDLVVSIGQVVPHEVIGMANHIKNIYVGTGGREGIGKSHFLGAVYGLERIMGRADTPVRRVLSEADRRFGGDLPVVYVLTVVEDCGDDGMVVRGLFIGDDDECFSLAAALSARVNITYLDRPPSKVVAYMDPSEYHSTWIANKAIYRTRLAIADEGELIVIAPAVREFGEDPDLDRLIARHGYHGTERVLAAMERDDELASSRSAAAHLIHGSPEGRFTVTYAAGKLAEDDIAAVGFAPMSLAEALARYPVDTLSDGWNQVGGEEVYFISNPALGLWARRGAIETT